MRLSLFWEQQRSGNQPMFGGIIAPKIREDFQIRWSIILGDALGPTRSDCVEVLLTLLANQGIDIQESERAVLSSEKGCSYCESSNFNCERNREEAAHDDIPVIEKSEAEVAYILLEMYNRKITLVTDSQ